MIEQKRKQIENLITKDHEIWAEVSRLTEELNTLLFEEAIKQKLFSELDWRIENEWYLYATEKFGPLKKLFKPDVTSLFSYNSIQLGFNNDQVYFYFAGGYETMREWVEKLNLSITTQKFEKEIKVLQNKIAEIEKLIALSNGL